MKVSQSCDLGEVRLKWSILTWRLVGIAGFDQYINEQRTG